MLKNRTKLEWLVIIALMAGFLYSAGMVAGAWIDRMISREDYNRIHAGYLEAAAAVHEDELMEAASSMNPVTSGFAVEDPFQAQRPGQQDSGDTGADAYEPPFVLDMKGISYYAEAAYKDYSAIYEANKAEAEAAKYDKNGKLVKFAELLRMNKDTVGWISIAGTDIHYPVVQGEDNDYYLHYTFKKRKGLSGAIFMDYRNQQDAKWRNTILYGHQMKDGSMFTQLSKYKNKSFFEEHPIITFDSLTEEQSWYIFSVYVTDASYNYIRTDFENKADYGAFLKEIARKSWFKSDTTVSSNDEILTLSTCSYETNNSRMVVHAKKIKY